MLQELQTIDNLRIVVTPTCTYECLPTNRCPHPNYCLTKVLRCEERRVTIYLATWQGPDLYDLVTTGENVIVKRCRSDKESNCEISMLQRLMHKTNPFQDFFVKLIHVHDVSATECDIVLQFGGIDLYDEFLSTNTFHDPTNESKIVFVDNDTSITKRAKRLSFLMTKLLTCVTKLHTLRFVHNDIKPENIVVDSNDNVRLIDFDIASVAYTINVSSTNSNNETDISCNSDKIGSIGYIHPYLLSEEESLSLYHNDLWAIAQTCWTLYTMQQTKMYNNDRCLLHLDWYKHIRADDEEGISSLLQKHESFPLVCAFITRLCNKMQRPTCANMMLLQEPFLCYWRCGGN